MNSQLKRLITDKLVEFNNNSRKVIKFLKENNLWNEVKQELLSDGESLYIFIRGTKKQCPDNKIRFSSFSVGYVFCGPANQCNCARRSVAESVSKTKKEYSLDKKQQIQEKREETNLERYGTKNFFSDNEKVKSIFVEKYGVDNPRHLDHVNQKIRATNLEKYGVDNPSKNPEIKQKQVAAWKENSQQHIDKYKAIFVEKYGVDNPRHLDHVNQKIRATNLEKYGVDNPSKNPVVVEKIRAQRFNGFYSTLDQRVLGLHQPMFAQEQYQGTQHSYEWTCKCCNTWFIDNLKNGRVPICRNCNPLYCSAFEQEVYDFVTHSDPSLCVQRNDRSLIAPKELDLIFPDKKVAIECNGIYWHSELNGRDRKYHLNKTDAALHQGYRLIHLTDYLWYGKTNIAKSVIMSALGLTQRLYARNCTISHVSPATKQLFLLTNHAQGDAASSVNLALTHKQSGEVVAVMTLAKSRYSKQTEWEMIRYCQLTGTTVVGGANKLFAHFIKKYLPRSVVSYADRSMFSGNMYSALGFVLSHNSLPGYRYFKKKQKLLLENRLKFQKHKLSKILTHYDHALTEWQNMIKNDYDRYWDCGNSVWLWNNQQGNI